MPVSEMRERYQRLYTGAVNDVLRFTYKMHAASLPSDYRPLAEDAKLAGMAFTIKGAPDITTEGEFEMRAEMLEALHEDTVVVWDCTGDVVTSQWGEVMTMAAIRAGCRGAVVNGIRDTRSIMAQQFPVFYKYRVNTGMFGRFRMYYYQKPVLIGEVIVHPGDWIFGDIDGVICIPRDIAYDVLLAAEKILYKEEDIKAMVRSGMKPTEVVKNGGYF
ncbi:RraA family protein [Compostibacter hankyongensis]|uniref:RraA family protein n=1 Tax=Compostibacter hankyongensis TaxID=1007089 RepID=UPI0031F1307D